jgi:hypothetical protein
MSKNRREFVAQIAAVGVGAAATAAVLSAPQEAMAQVTVAHGWKELQVGVAYEVTDPAVAITVMVLHKSGDFRGAATGEVDNQVRGIASAGWSDGHFGLKGNTFTMFANKGQVFKVTKSDDFADTYPRAWEIKVLVSGGGTSGGCRAK